MREGVDVGVQEVERALLLAVPDTEMDAKTADELMDTTGLKKTTVREALARMVKEGVLADRHWPQERAVSLLVARYFVAPRGV